MKHLDENQILQLAKRTNDYLPYNDEEEIWLDHLEQCEECFEQFKLALVISDALSVESEAYISRLTEMVAQSEVSVKETVIGAVKYIRSGISGAFSEAKELFNKATSVFCFEPAFLGARGTETPLTDGTVKANDTFNEGTFITYDPKTKELIIELRQEDCPPEKLSAFVETESGDRIDIPLKITGITASGKISLVHSENFTVKIIREE